MKLWNVEFWVDDSGESPIQKWLDQLPDEHLKGLAKVIRILGECGNTLRMPYSRALDSGLFELRERRFGFRIYYCFRDQRVVLLLCGGNKDSQQRDIKKARNIMKHIEQEESK